MALQHQLQLDAMFWSISELLFTISVLVLAQPQFPSQSSKTSIPVWIPLEFLCSIGMCWCANRSSAGPVRAKQQQWSASACYKAWCSSKERKINPGVFFHACIQRKCSMSEGRFITYPQNKTSPDDENMIGRRGSPTNFCSTVTAITLTAPKHPTFPEKVLKGRKGNHEKSTKDILEEKGWNVGERSCLSITGKCTERLQKPPERVFGGLFNVAKSKCFIALPSIREKTRKFLPHMEKNQQNWRIKATFRGTQSHRSRW